MDCMLRHVNFDQSTVGRRQNQWTPMYVFLDKCFKNDDVLLFLLIKMFLLHKYLHRFLLSQPTKPSYASYAIFWDQQPITSEKCACEISTQVITLKL